MLFKRCPAANAPAVASITDPEMRKNVEALTPVIPKDIAPTDIIAPVGAPWVEAKDVSQFATELTGSEPDTVLFQKANAGWTFRHTDRSNASTQQWGTERMPFGDLFKQMLNGKAIVVYDELDKADGGTVRVLGLDPWRDHARLVEDLGVMLQRGGVYPGIRVREVVRLFRAYYSSGRDPDELVEAVGLGERA